MIAVITPQGDRLVYRAGDDRMPTAEVEANARLIAAAPDLLAALSDCIQVLAGHAMQKDALISALQSGHAAIKKATQP